MILVEAKYYPFVLMSVRGNHHTESEYGVMFDAMDAVARKALRDGTRHLVISVSNHNMSAGERKFVATRAAAIPSEQQAVSLGTYVIVESAAFRGVLTALRWLAPSLVSIDPVGSVEAAMSSAVATFKRERIQVDGVCARRARQWLEEQTRLQQQAPSTLL
jgi:hypothetical protein